MFKLLLLIAICISAVLSEEGYCPKVKLMQNFKPDEYMGQWYEIQRYPMFFEDETKCVMAEYTLNKDGTIGVYNEAILISIDEIISIKGRAIPDANNPANLTVKFDKVPVDGKYWVLDTNYKTYSLIYGCQQARDAPIRVEFAWILSRKSVLSRRIISRLTKKLESFGSTVSNFEMTDQTDCDSSDQEIS